MHEVCIVFYVDANTFYSCNNSNYRFHIKNKSGFMIHALIISHLRILFTYLLMNLTLLFFTLTIWIFISLLSQIAQSGTHLMAIGISWIIHWGISMTQGWDKCFLYMVYNIWKYIYTDNKCQYKSFLISLFST